MADQWYYSGSAEPKGPVPLSELQRLASAGELQPTDLLWQPGMHLWMPAADVRGLFRAARPELPAVPPLQPIPVEPAIPQPRPVTPRGPTRPLRRTPPPRGMSAGAKSAIAGGVIAVLVLVVVVLVVFLSNRRPSSRRVPRAVNAGGFYVVNLNPNVEDIKHLHFFAGRQVTITVTSEFKSDVDLYVYDSFGNKVASDVRADPNCFVSFRAQVTGQYRIRVVNLGPGFNRAVVRYN
jgi:hypothetical protein